jgi:general secretion pathway protein D
MPIHESKPGYITAFIFLAVTAFVSGCGTMKVHSDGMSLIQEGHIEEGLAKLETASKDEPENMTYRSDYLRSKNQVTNSMNTTASRERGFGHLDVAQSIYERILKIDPDNKNAKAAIDSMGMDRRHDVILEEARSLFDKGDVEEARAALKPIFIENPRHGPAILLLRQIDERQNKTQTAEPTLTGKFKKPISLQFREANLKMVFEALSRISGINVLIDKDVRPDIKTTIFVKDVSVEDAIDLILMQGQLEKKILSNNTIYVYPNSAAKTKEFQDLKIRSFHLTNADPKQMMTLIKTMLKTKDVFVHEKTNSVVMRDTPDAIHLAEKLIADQDIADPEVMLEVEVLEISRSRLYDIGAKFPNQMTFTAQANTVTSAATTTAASAGPLTVNVLKNLNLNNIVVSPSPALTLNAMLQDSDTNVLSSPRLRVKNRDKAKIMIGDRVPIITNSLTPTNTGPGVVTGTVSYQDVGLKLDVEPDIHLDNEVTIKISLEVSSLGLAVTNPAGSTVYQIGTRNTSTSLRLRDGETQILAGLISDSDRSTVDKVPLLGQIPILGHLFSNDNGSKAKNEIILSITPHIVGNAKLPDAREMEYWSGTESVLKSTQLTLKPLGAVSLSGSASTPSSALPRLPIPVQGMPLTAIPQADVAASNKAVLDKAAADKTAADKAAADKVQPQPVKTPEPVSASPISLSWQGPNQGKVGDKITLALNAKSTQGVKALAFHVEFDSSVLKAVDVAEGDSMKRNNASSTFSKKIDQEAGDIEVDLVGRGADGAGKVFALTFEVIGTSEESTVSFSSVSALGESGQAIPLPSPEPHVISVAK